MSKFSGSTGSRTCRPLGRRPISQEHLATRRPGRRQGAGVAAVRRRPARNASVSRRARSASKGEVLRRTPFAVWAYNTHLAVTLPCASLRNSAQHRSLIRADLRRRAKSRECARWGGLVGGRIGARRLVSRHAGPGGVSVPGGVARPAEGLTSAPRSWGARRRGSGWGCARRDADPADRYRRSR